MCDRGRPLEFHCTEPVRPSRAQEILFGATLREHVCGEQIGAALLAKTKIPIGFLLTRGGATAAAGREAGLTTLVLDEAPDHVPAGSPLERLAESIDPAEPFERVAEAIREAQRLSGGGEARDAA